MDEPFAHLDAVTRLELQDLAARLLAGRTAVLVTHDPLEALRVGHQIRVLSGSPFTVGPFIEPPGAVPRDPADPALLALQARLFAELRGAPHEAADHRARPAAGLGGAGLGDRRAALHPAAALARRAGAGRALRPAAGRSRLDRRRNGARAGPRPDPGRRARHRLRCIGRLAALGSAAGHRLAGHPGDRHRAAAGPVAGLRHGIEGGDGGPGDLLPRRQRTL